MACGLPCPEGFVRVATHSVGWWTIVFWTHGARFSTEVPACEPCRRQMIRQRWIRSAANVVFAAVGVGIAIYVLGTLRNPLRAGSVWGSPFFACSPG